MNAVIDLKDAILETDRLILREWKECDLNDFFEYASVDGVGQMAGWQPHKSVEESASILKMVCPAVWLTATRVTKKSPPKPGGLAGIIPATWPGWTRMASTGMWVARTM